MEHSGFIVGIDLGTSKIVGLLGRKNEQGIISILASETIPSDSCIKHGVIYNIDDAAGKIKKMINLLENKSGKKIARVYVSIAGRSLRAVEHSQVKAFESEMPVTFAVLDQMEQLARSNKQEFLTNYSVVSPEIFLDGVFQADPIDKLASLIEGRYRLIVGRPNLKSNLTRVFTDKNQLNIAGFIVGPVAVGALVLEDADKEAGCALVDFGAGTTTVSIYKGGLLRYMTVVPFGGRSVTRDVQDLGFIDSAAEAYKIRYGRVGKDKLKNLNTPTSSEVDLKELNKVIQFRVEEIVLNVINQLKESGFVDQLPSGIVITGGASQLEGLVEYLSEKSQLSVKRAEVKRLYINNAADLVQNPIYTQALSVMLFASENCEKQEVIEQPKPEPVFSVVEENEVEEEEQEQEQSKGDKKNDKRQKKFDFWGKLQSFGGAVFEDEK